MAIENLKNIMNINSQLSDEIIQLIFTKVSFFNLPNCREVCKAWNNLVLTGKFFTPIFNHFNFAYISSHQNLFHCINFDAKGMNIVASATFHPNLSNIKIVGSCNGLVCFIKSKSSTIIEENLNRTSVVGILNLMTNEFMTLPRGKDGVFYHYGFGFSPKTNQYRVIRHSFAHKNATTLVEIFTIGSNKWSHVASVPLRIDRHCVYLNGALYWVGYLLRSRDDNNKRVVMWRLDVEDQKFEEISFPVIMTDSYCRCMFNDSSYLNVHKFWVFNGSLYLTIHKFSTSEYNIWKMETYENKEDHSYSWTRAFVVSFPSDEDKKYYYLRFIKTCENGKILCIRGDSLRLYDSKTGTTEAWNPITKDTNFFLNYQIDSVSFDSLATILAGES